MGVRVRVHEGESIWEALHRLNKLLVRNGQSWEVRKRFHFVPATKFRRYKEFQKRFKARQQTLLAQKAGEQPVASIPEAVDKFWKRTGKP